MVYLIWILAHFSIIVNFSQETEIELLYPINHISKIKLNFTDYNILQSGWVNTYISSSFFNQEKVCLGSPIKKKKILNLTKEYEGEQYMVNLEINGYKAPNFNYYYLEEITYIPEQGYSFAHNYEDESFSLIHTLYNNNQIKKKFFGFQIGDNNAKMFIGKIPDINLSYKGYFYVKKSSPVWETTLNNIQANGKSVELNTTVVFNSAFYNIICSNEFFQFVVQDHLKNEFVQKLCFQEEVDSDYHEEGLFCSNEALNNFGTLQFHFNDLVINLNKEHLFDRFNDTFMQSKFITNPYPHYNFTILGFEFLELFNYSIFDYDKNSISFYSDQIEMQQITIVSESKFSKLLISFTIILCFIAILYDGFIFINKLCVIN